jgi:hypothetical protein
MHRLDSGHFAIEDSLSEIAGKMIAFYEKHVGRMAYGLLSDRVVTISTP